MNKIGKKKSLWLLMIILSQFLISQCSSPQESGPENSISEAPAKDLASVILRVGPREYTNADFAAYLTMSVGKGREELPLEALNELVINFVEDKLLLAAAEQKGIVVTWPEIKSYLARMKANLSTTEPIQTSEELESLKEALLIEKYIETVVADVEVKEDEMRQYYQEHKRDFLLADRVQVSQILVNSEEKAVELRQQLQEADEQKFREVARQNSLGVEAAQGGLMGVFEMGQLPYAFDKVVFTLEEGQLSRVIESSYGYHIFRLDKKIPAELMSFDQAKEKIRIKVLEIKIKNRLQEHLQWLKENLDWIFLPENLTFPYQRKKQ